MDETAKQNPKFKKSTVTKGWEKSPLAFYQSSTNKNGIRDSMVVGEISAKPCSAADIAN